MQATEIFGPFFAIMGLTFAVWTLMYVRRIRHVVSERIDPQQLTTPEKAAVAIPERISYPANNLRNLFELPVLFYALCIYLFVTNRVDLTYIAAAWVFVAFRVLHSLVHCTTNHVMSRFRFYMVAALTLWFMLIRAVIQSISSVD